MMATATPSKAAADAFSQVSLDTSPKMDAGVLAKLKAAAAADAANGKAKADAPASESDSDATPAPDAAPLTEAELRERYVGDIYCPESEEPLLKETAQRFVLFPIRYREVS